MIRRLAAAGVAVLVVGAGVTGCGSGSAENPASPKDQATIRARAATFGHQHFGTPMSAHVDCDFPSAPSGKPFICTVASGSKLDFIFVERAGGKYDQLSRAVPGSKTGG